MRSTGRLLLLQKLKASVLGQSARLLKSLSIMISVSSINIEIIWERISLKSSLNNPLNIVYPVGYQEGDFISEFESSDFFRHELGQIKIVLQQELLSKKSARLFYQIGDEFDHSFHFFLESITRIVNHGNVRVTDPLLSGQLIHMSCLLNGFISCFVIF